MITELEILQYFENKQLKTRHGVYKCKIIGDDNLPMTRFLVLSNNTVYVICHYYDKSTLEICNSIKDELLKLIDSIKTMI
jgi:hypothetical protein